MKTRFNKENIEELNTEVEKPIEVDEQSDENSESVPEKWYRKPKNWLVVGGVAAAFATAGKVIWDHFRHKDDEEYDDYEDDVDDQDDESDEGSENEYPED